MAPETLILIAAFLLVAASLLIGVWAKRQVKSQQDFVGGTGLFGPMSVALSSMAATASAFALVGVPGQIYDAGMAMGYWMLSSGAFALGFIMVGKKVCAISKVGQVSTLGDISDLRFNNNRTIKLLMSIVIFIGCIAYLASQIAAGTELFAHLFGWNPLITGFVLYGIIILYMALSGEVGGILTQSFQGFIMVVAAAAMIIFFFATTGGFGSVLEVTETAGTVSDGELEKTFTPDLMRSIGAAPGAVAMAFMVIPIIGAVGQPQAIMRMYALRDPFNLTKAGIYAGISHGIVGAFAVTAGLGALYLVGSGEIAPLESPDYAIFAFADYTGVIGQVLSYTAILCATMSSSSLFLSVCSTILSRDIPKSFGKTFSSQKQLYLTRITIVILGVAAILFATFFEEMVAILGTFGWGTLMSATFPVFIVGLLWKKASSQGVIAGLVVALVLNVGSLILEQMGFVWPSGLPYYVFAVSAAIAVTVFVSLFTKGATGEELDNLVEKAMDL